MKRPGGKKGERIHTIRRLMFWWIVGSGIALIILYGFAMERYFRFGIKLRTQVQFEQIGGAYKQAKEFHGQAQLPVVPGLVIYTDIAQIPDNLMTLFSPALLADLPGHERMQVAVLQLEEDMIEGDFNQELDGIHQHFPVELMPMCGPVQCNVYFFYAYEVSPDEWLYMGQGIVPSSSTERYLNVADGAILVFSFTVFMLFAVLAYILVRKISQPVQRLERWASDLDPEQLSKEVPDFTFRELNLVANQLKQAFERIASSLHKEHQFLQHASHELRTPLAVASGNLELLALMKKQSTTEAEEKAYSRLTYAIKDMQQLTETLLWLHRDNDVLPAIVPVELKQLVERLVEDNRYLLHGKPVAVVVTGMPVTIEAQEIMSNIVLNNLIRNAFQHTAEGVVHIA